MKKVVAAAVILFAGFFLLTQPAAAADIVQNVASMVGGVFETVIEFLNALFD